MKPTQQKTEPSDGEKPSPGDLMKPALDIALPPENFGHMTKFTIVLLQFVLGLLSLSTEGTVTSHGAKCIL